MWWETYESLDLRGGQADYILNDSEDMIEITYPDGMLIDIGKAESTGLYYITVVASNDAKGWRNPLYELPVSDKEALPGCIEQVIRQFRPE